MSIEVKTPKFPESVEEGTVAKWHKQPGESIEQDENLVDIETDKIVLEVPAPQKGVVQSIQKPQGATVKSGEVLAILETEVTAKKAHKSEAPSTTPPPEKKPVSAPEVSPSVRRLIEQHKLNIEEIAKTMKGDRITKEDVFAFVEKTKKGTKQPETPPPSPEPTIKEGERPQKRVPMTRLRARIAERLVEVQQTAAILTSFNEINLHAIKNLRERHREKFEKTYGVKLGWMSFFVKAAIEGLKRFPEINASIDGQDVVYHGFYDIGIAVSTPRGLVVPILKNADSMTLANMERAINDFANRARSGKLVLEEMTGGTFTITNGGVFGSLFSTPIINPPQSAILGMHKVQDRPVAENGSVVIRPMMYIALSYDHRLIDGREAVSFLVTVKELLEDPSRLLLEI